MQTPPISSIPADSYSAVAGAGTGLPANAVPDPDNPPWSMKTAVLTWLGSVGILLGVSLFSSVIALLYVLSTYGSVRGEELTRLITSDKMAVLIQVSGVIPVHLLTLVLVWFVVTGRGKRPFWRTLGWRFNNKLEPLLSVLLAVGLLAFGAELTRRYGGDPTDIDQIINSSTASRLVLAFLATATAPLVEEIVYRGILYSALQRAIGVAWAVVAVSLLFMSVHIAQYYNNISVIAAIGVLSLALTLVRAYTKSLLPCFIIHLVFNGLQSLYIIFQPYITKPETAPTQQQGVTVIWQLLGACVP